MTFDQAVEFVLGEEAGYVHDPHDAGGETKYGISRRSFPELDIANLTREQAIAIYRKEYWNHCQCDQLPDGLDLLVFDAAVNQGQVAAIRMLQNALKVSADGIMGAITIRAAQHTEGLLSEYLARRLYAYANVPQVMRFGLGWFRRTMRMAERAFARPA